MGSKGGTRTLKRYASPYEWPVLRKRYKWVVKPSPGPHNLENSIPLLVALRDLMHLVQTSHEAKVVLSQEKIRVNGRVVRRVDLPVGVMDVISVEDTGAQFRMLPLNGALTAHLVADHEKDVRIMRIENKVITKNSTLQLNLTGGHNVCFKLGSPIEAKESPYFTLDSVVTDLKGRKISGHIRLKEGSYVLVVKGKNSGQHGLLAQTVPSFKRRRSLVHITTGNGGSIETVLDYVYAVGENKPIISLPEVV
jgi:small subunit ribosomal protein S4e